MGAKRTHRPGGTAAVPEAGGGGRSAGAHRLLALQRSVGNQAVTQVVQREEHDRGRDHPAARSRVALATLEKVYAGRSEAQVPGARVGVRWNGRIDKLVSVVFVCGDASFRFSASYHLDNRVGQWHLDAADGTPVAVTLTRELDDVYGHYFDPGATFQAAYYAVVDALAADVRDYHRIAGHHDRPQPPVAEPPAQDDQTGPFHLSSPGHQAAEGLPPDPRSYGPRRPVPEGPRPPDPGGFHLDSPGHQTADALANDPRVYGPLPGEPTQEEAAAAHPRARKR